MQSRYRHLYEPPTDWGHAILEGTIFAVVAIALIAFALAAMEVW